MLFKSRSTRLERAHLESMWRYLVQFRILIESRLIKWFENILEIIEIDAKTYVAVTHVILTLEIKVEVMSDIAGALCFLLLTSCSLSCFTH